MLTLTQPNTYFSTWTHRWWEAINRTHCTDSKNHTITGTNKRTK